MLIPQVTENRTRSHPQLAIQDFASVYPRSEARSRADSIIRCGHSDRRTWFLMDRWCCSPSRLPGPDGERSRRWPNHPGTPRIDRRISSRLVDRRRNEYNESCLPHRQDWVGSDSDLAGSDSDLADSSWDSADSDWDLVDSGWSRNPAEEEYADAR